MSDTIARTTAKTVLYRVLGSAVTFAISYGFTGHAALSAGISVTEFVFKPLFYWGYERVWTKIKWGVR